MQINISIIVPVYNVEKYLDNCIQSILNQTIINIELILVDDGSSDSSGEICDRYARQDDRVKVVHKINEGPAAARNQGIAIAKGKYLGFVDSDDWIEQDMYSTLYENAIEAQADIVYCDYIMEYVDHNYPVKTARAKEVYNINGIKMHILPYFFGYEDHELINYKSHCPFADYSSYVWLALYKRDVINNYGILFPSEKTFLNEDNLFNLDMAFHSSTILHIPGYFYHYRQYDNSFTSNFHREFLQMKIKKYELLNDLIVKNGLDEEYKMRLYNKICIELSTIINYYANTASLNWLEKRYYIKNCIISPLILHALLNVNIRSFSSKFKLSVFLAKRKAVFLLIILSIAYRIFRTLLKK